MSGQEPKQKGNKSTCHPAPATLPHVNSITVISKALCTENHLFLTNAYLDVGESDIYFPKKKKKKKTRKITE